MRIVIKVGTSLLTTPGNQLDLPFLRELAKHLARMHASGHDIVIVSSGAVAAGRSELTIEREKKAIPYRQALAAVGQGILISAYHNLFGAFGIKVSQALLTNYDFVNRENFLNTRNVFDLLLKARVIPIVNENDVTTVAELKFGDNDLLSAKTAAMLSADCLVILTDVAGLYTEDPGNNPRAEKIPVVEKVDDSIKALAKGARSKSSMGGMVTKLEAAEYVTSVGIPMFILSGKHMENLEAMVSGKERTHGTYFPSSVSRLESRKKWMRPKILRDVWIEIDNGAAEAISKGGKSLLPSGITKIHGVFERGDIVTLKHGGRDIGYGHVGYSSQDLDKIKGRHSREIEVLLGYSYESDVMHRDRMVILD